MSTAGSTQFTVHCPATLEPIAEVVGGTAHDAVAAVDRAHRAFQEWSRWAPRKRSEVLYRTFEYMLRDTDVIAALIARENGKSLADARAEVIYAAEYFRWFAEEAVRPGGEYGEAPAGGVRTIVTHRPVGVAALVTPWNFPAAMATRKIAPALAVGCTAVLKPAAETPLTAIKIGELLAEAGLPAGCLEIVPTLNAGEVVTAWMEDSRVRKISFTGSTGIGRLLLHQAADRVVNASMELGGNAPFIVTADADIDAAVAGAMIAKFRNGGQACTAANRFYVHADVAEQFVAAFGAKVTAMKVGASRDGAAVGPMINEAAVNRIRSSVDAAVAGGAKIAAVAVMPDLPGYFYPPTVLVDVPEGSELLTEEIFGPVAPIVTWTDEAEMLAEVNDTEFGLAAYVFAGDIGRSMRIAEQVEAGMVGVNRGLLSDASAPFGGIKQSGHGREGAREGLTAYTEAQYLSVDWPSY